MKKRMACLILVVVGLVVLAAIVIGIAQFMVSAGWSQNIGEAIAMIIALVAVVLLVVWAVGVVVDD